MSEVRMYLTPVQQPPADARASTASLSDLDRKLLRTDVHQELLKSMELEKLSKIQADASGGRQRLLSIIYQLVGEQQIPLSASDRDQVAAEVLDEVVGLGPLEPLLHDPTISDILVNTFDTVFVERRGILQKTNISFRDNAHLMHIIDKMVSAVGRRIDESSPMVDARLCSTARGST